MPRLGLGFAALALLSCREVEHDGALACIAGTVEDRIVIEVRQSCASDHRGAELSCDIEIDGDVVRVTSEFLEGRDPDDSCAADLRRVCTSEPLPAGEYELQYADASVRITVPGARGFCLRGTEVSCGTSHDDTGTSGCDTSG